VILSKVTDYLQARPLLIPLLPPPLPLVPPPTPMCLVLLVPRLQVILVTVEQILPWQVVLNAVELLLPPRAARPLPSSLLPPRLLPRLRPPLPLGLVASVALGLPLPQPPVWLIWPPPPSLPQPVLAGSRRSLFSARGKPILPLPSQLLPPLFRSLLPPLSQLPLPPLSQSPLFLPSQLPLPLLSQSLLLRALLSCGVAHEPELIQRLKGCGPEPHAD
jgi:hypothetical protein